MANSQSELDKRLADICANYVDSHVDFTGTVKAIKEAFVEAGWGQIGIVGNVVEQAVDYHAYVGANGRPDIPLIR